MSMRMRMRMNLNNVTFTKLLLLSAAVYISWSGVCCDWFRGLQKFLRLRIGGNHGSSEASFLRHHHHHHHRYNASEPTGIYFSRSISSWSPESPLQVQFDSKDCKETDVYGENNCHFDWGDQVAVNYSIYVNQTLDESAYLEGTFKVGKVPWHFTCSICGEDCQMKMPMIDFDFSFPMPPCPVNSEAYADTILFPLWKKSPTQGWIAIPLEGEAIIYSKPNELFANISIHATIK